MEKKESVFETPDLGLAAYLKMKGLKLKEIGKDKKRYKFIFLDPHNRIEELKVEFINSESYNFDSSVRVLKLMIKSESPTV